MGLLNVGFSRIKVRQDFEGGLLMATLTAPSTESCKISRDHLTASEVKLLIEAVKNHGGWYSYRRTADILILLANSKNTFLGDR